MWHANALQGNRMFDPSNEVTMCQARAARHEAQDKLQYPLTPNPVTKTVTGFSDFSAGGCLAAYEPVAGMYVQLKLPGFGFSVRYRQSGEE